METGTRLGPYEILEPLGAGGMGEVWLARDSRLGREVAIKVLPAEYASDPERLARFEQEARAAAALNHPHIAVVHDIGSEGDTHFMVQEYLQGQSLRERLEKKALPLDQALDLAIEVGEALIAAHKAGIVHRDLKPDNIFVTEQGHAKVLDFGLAKLVEGTAPSLTSASMSPTVLGTVVGQIMGTAGYMAPEQVNGEGIDHRADLFAFGCVLYEMVAGKQPFAGRNVHDTLGRIVDQDPDSLTSIDANMPVEAQRIVKKCLAKDRARRYQAADDLVVDLQTLSAEFQAGQAISLGDVRRPAGASGAAGGAADGTQEAPAHGTSGRSIPLGWAAVILVVTSVLVGSGVRGLLTPTSPADQPITAFDIPTPSGIPFSFTGRHAVAISRDGREMVFTADSQLQRRRMNAPDIVPIAGTEGGGRNPFFSPDGTQVGFWYPTQEGGELRKVSISGGLPTLVCQANNPFGATWLDDGTILYGQGSLGIMRVPADGGDPEVVIPVRENETAHGPQLLPDRDSVLFTLRTGGGPWDDSQTVVVSLADPRDREVLFSGGEDARYLSTGHIAYVRAGTLMARSFDLDRQEVGAEVQLVDGIYSSFANLTGATQFATSDTGALVYIPDTAVGSGSLHWVVWATPTNDITFLPGGDLDNPLAPRLSPDETHVAVMVTGTDGIPQVEVQELSRGIWTRLTTDGDGQFPVWSHDGTSIYFTSTRGTEPAIYRRPIDLSSPAQEIWRHGGQGITLVDSASRDGKLLFVTITGDTLPESWLVRLGDPVSAEPLFDGVGFHGHAQIHPSGKWIAYAREAQSQRDILVSEFPAGRTVQISDSGDSEEHMWSRDGRQLFYRAGGNMMVVDVQTEPDFRPGKPRELINRFVGDDATLWVATSKYDVSSDGTFLTTLGSRPEDAATDAPGVRVILNWFAQLTQRVPTGR